MQLRLTNPLLASFSATFFKSSTTVLLSGITLTGVFSTLLFSTTTTTTTIENQLDNKFQEISKLLKASSFYEGIQKVGEKLKDWGKLVISTKDDLKNWIVNYLNTSGFKSGAVELYNKLYDWALIVYDWFANKFLKFISNIPEMVKNWKQLRLSLFKWGTFLGGGGGSALWAMFGNGDNWGKFAELMGNPKFAETLGNISELMSENSDSFSSMTQEDVQAIMEKVLDDHEEANEIAKDLLNKQKEKNKEKSEEEKEQLEAQEITDSFSNEKGGKPQNPQQALGDFIASGLKKILEVKNSFGADPFETARGAMKEHIEHLKKESQRKTKFAQVKKDFLEAIKDQETLLINNFANLSNKAYQAYNIANKSENNKNEKLLASIFENFMKEEFTKEAGVGEKGDAQFDGMVTSVLK